MYTTKQVPIAAWSLNCITIKKETKAMTRFEKELSGALGTFWKKNAEMEVERFQTSADQGEIILDADGAARWKTNQRYISNNYRPELIEK